VVIERILRYLTEHPDAKDALEGIQKYWLHSNLLAPSAEEIQQSLRALVQRGWVVASESNATPKLYRLNKCRIEEINGFLKRVEHRQNAWH